MLRDDPERLGDLPPALILVRVVVGPARPTKGGHLVELPQAAKALRERFMSQLREVPLRRFFPYTPDPTVDARRRMVTAQFVSRSCLAQTVRVG